MERLTGVHVALLTPMTADESLDLGAVPEGITRCVSAGVHGLFCLGTNGESYALTTAEKTALMEAVAAARPAGVVLGAGVGCTTTRATIELACRAREMGYDYVSVITPWFAAVGQEELYRHYRAVAEAARLPVVLYNIPARTGNRIEVETARRLAEAPNIVGIKDSSGDLANLQALIRATGQRLSILCGADHLILETLRAGGQGSVSGLANLVPATVTAVYEATRAGDQAKAERAQASLARLREALAGGNPSSAVKRAAVLLGHRVGPAREPVAGVPAAVEKRLAAALEAAMAVERELLP